MKELQQREYFYSLNLRGELIHEGIILDDPDFIRLFYKFLKPNDSGKYQQEYPWLSICGKEYMYLYTPDTPAILQRVLGDKCEYAPGLQIDFKPENLRFGPNGILYYMIPGQWAIRVSAALTMELSNNIQPWGPWFAYINKTEQFQFLTIIPPLDIPEHLMLLAPKPGNYCAGCGVENPLGLRLNFLFNKELNQSETWLMPDARLMGSLNIMHGGFIALLLDESMGKVLSGMGIKAPTGQLTIRYKAPVPMDRPIHLQASLEHISGRKYTLFGRVLSESGEVLAQAQALFIARRGELLA